MSFARLVARAAPPPERAGSGAFEPVATDAGVLARRQRALTDAFGSAAALDAHAEALGLAPDAWRARFRDARLAGPLPDWARAFEALFERIQDSERPFAEFRRWAGAQAAARWPAGLRRGPDALDGPLDYLAQRFGAALEPVLHVDGKLGHRPSWRERFRRHPALGYALGRIAADWLADLERIAAAAAADLSLLSRAVFGGAEPGALTAIEPGLGDPHNGGRSVAILRFEGGRVVYKPKDLRIAAAVGEIAAPFAGAGLAPPQLIVREGYAWEPVYEPRPVADRREADAFFAALGGWLALLQALGATDFWFDNLIAEGAAPRFIDFETALQPPFGRSAGDEAAERAGTSPLGVGILPMLMPARDGGDAIDIGCLARPGEHRTPLDRLDGGGAVTWHEDRFAPRYAGGEAADAADHFDAFEEGYLRIARALAAPASWRRVSDALGRIAGAPVRIIRIDTWTCYRLIRQSFAPRHLSDGAWREIALHAVLPRKDDMTGALREAAARDLRRVDIPLFQMPVDSRDLLGVDGERRRDFFDRAPAAAVRGRLRALARLDDDERRAWLRSGFSLRPDNPPRRRPAPPGRPPPAGGTAAAGDLLAWADEIASDVLRLAVADAHGLPTWLGLYHDVFTGWRIVGPLGFDVLSGQAGLARALLDLAGLLDRGDLAAIAREAAAGAGRAYLDRLAANLSAGAGHAVGAGGLVATLAGIADLRPLAAEIWRAAAAAEVWMYSGGDFVSGLAGWTAAAAALGEPAPDGNGRDHGRARAYAPSALPRLARWLDPDAAVPLCAGARAAARLREDRDRHGSWFAAGWLDDRHNLSGIDGLPALAVAFARLARRA